MSIYISNPRKRGPHCSGVETAIMWQQPGFMDISTIFKGNSSENNKRALYDNIDSIGWVEPSGYSELGLRLPNARAFNCIAMAGCNWSALDSFAIDGYVPDDDDLRTIFGSVSPSWEDGQPILIRVDEFEYSELIFQLNKNKEFRIGEIAFGNAFIIPNSPSVGFQPSSWNWRDKITHQITEGGLVGCSTITPMGSEQAMKFPFIPKEFMDNEWSQFVATNHGKPIWCSWNWNKDSSNNENVKECIYGAWEQRGPEYGALSSIKMTMMGASL